MLVRLFLLNFLLLLAHSPALALEPPSLKPFALEYKSTFAGFGAKTTRELKEIEPGLWQLTMKSKNMVASYRETSQFRLDEDGYPIPQTHYFKGKLFGIGREEFTEFDWQAGTATWKRKGKMRVADIHPGVLDRILYQVQVPAVIAEGDGLASVEFVNRGNLRVYDFERLGTETISVSNQEIETIKVRRVDDDNIKQTTVWIAPGMDYEIVKIHHRDDDGDDYEIELKL